MQGARRYSLKTRATVIALTLAVHALFLLLLWIEGQLPRLEAPALPQEINAWILLPPVQPPTEPEAAEEPPPVPRSSTPARATTRAITLPPTEESPPAGPSETTGPDIDWRAEAAKLTAGYGEDEVEHTGIGKPLPRLREPCKPRERSFEWKAEQEARSKGGIGGLTLGWIPNPPNDGFFDDMQAGKTPKSSVPSPHVCD